MAGGAAEIQNGGAYHSSSLAKGAWLTRVFVAGSKLGCDLDVVYIVARSKQLGYARRMHRSPCASWYASHLRI